MVTLRNDSASGRAVLTIESAGKMTEREIGLPTRGTEQNFFLDLPAVGQTAHASIDVQGPNSQFQPVSNASAAALPSDTTVKSSDHRIVVRVIYRLGFTLPFLR